MAQILIASLIYSTDIDPAPVLSEVVHALRARGVTMAGAIQNPAGSCSMALELLPSARRIAISRNLGGSGTGCRLDTAALAEAASMVRQAIDRAPSLAIFNKFGAQEAE